MAITIFSPNNSQHLTNYELYGVDGLDEYKKSMQKQMKDKITYTIKPRMKKRWFIKDTKVYDLLKHTEGQYWSDSSFGNGGGSFEDFDKTETIYTFETFGEAEQFKEELEK